jgi:hypothetical protein
MARPDPRGIVYFMRLLLAQVTTTTGPNIENCTVPGKTKEEFRAAMKGKIYHRTLVIFNQLYSQKLYMV